MEGENQAEERATPHVLGTTVRGQVNWPARGRWEKTAKRRGEGGKQARRSGAWTLPRDTGNNVRTRGRRSGNGKKELHAQGGVGELNGRGGPCTTESRRAGHRNGRRWHG